MTQAAGPPDHALFNDMEHSTAADWMLILRQMKPFADDLPVRVLAHLDQLRGDHGGFPVDRLDHCLQTATRAHQDGRDEEYVVMALLHDIGDTLATYNHADIAAAILRPFLSQENHWIAGHHDIFQGYYYFHHLGLDRDLREQFRGHPCFEATAAFAERYDQNAFDSRFDSAPLGFFEPMVRRVMARPRTALICEESLGATP